jgi:diguanylate cyclase (GGDEF)-like protein
MDAPATPAVLEGGRRPGTLTGRAFTDLAVWMVGLGIAMGVVFPFAVIVLGVPADITLRAGFFVGTVAAGLLVGGANFVLARRVVGRRLRELSSRMGYVGDVIGESTYSGDWSRCTPATCEVAVDSADEFGDAARSFNRLLAALHGSRQMEQAMAAFGDSLSEHLEVEDVARAALAGFVQHSSASAGAFGVVHEGDVVIEAAHRIDAEALGSGDGIRSALLEARTTTIEVPEGLVIDASLLSFRPHQVVVVPLRFKSVPVGVVVLAFAAAPPPELLRLLDTLASSCGVSLNNALTHQRLQHLAAVDPLTGAYNRRFGDGRLREEWARSVRASTPLGLLSFDLDHFKAINDTFGHLTGDRVLREVVRATRLALREGDVLVRAGGEEFLVVLPGAGRTDVQGVGERIRRAIAAASVTTEHAQVQVTVSLGGVSWPDVDANGPDDLLERLDEVLYQSKQAGRDRLTMVPAPPVTIAR